MRQITILLVFVFLSSSDDSIAQTFTRINTGAIVDNPGNNQGSSWADYDNDGNVDLFITRISYSGNKPNLLFHNTGNRTFTKVTTGTIANDIIFVSCSSSWGDYDNDGLPDLFTSFDFGGNNRLYRNEGNGNFTKFTPEMFGGDAADGCWADYDNDGYLDLIVGSVHHNHNLLYHNNGNGTFTQIDTGAIASDWDFFMSPSWADFDNDNDMDVFYATAFFDLPGSVKNHLYINHGNGYFTNLDSTAIVLSDSQWTPGASWGDYDNDGYLDLYVVDALPLECVSHLYHNNGDGTFTQITIDPPEASGALSIGSAWGDFDNDGYLDLFVTNDRNFPDDPIPSVRDNFFFHNNGNGTFTRITTGDIVKDGGHTCSVCDYDNDSDLDIVIANGPLASPMSATFTPTMAIAIIG